MMHKLEFSGIFPWIGFKRDKTLVPKNSIGKPLREFVYLDEVSLASLLASQKGELTDAITTQSGDTYLTEVGGGISSKATLLPGAELNSKFQTTNSASLQTVRKANAQSLFAELYAMHDTRRIRPKENIDRYESLEALTREGDPSVSCKASYLKRGDLLEFRVKLSASWIFQISTMVSEFSEMFDESPVLFIENVKYSDLYQANNVNKIIGKMLAGLIPIDGIASDYSVVRYQQDDYIVHNQALSGMNVDKYPLQIVGVTEHAAFWKDIRRILFAENEFTVLCRLSKSGIQDRWNPIKLTDIFRQFSPDLASQIEAASRAALASSPTNGKEDLPDIDAMQLSMALIKYRDRVVSSLQIALSNEQMLAVDRAIITLRVNPVTAEGHRAAFAHVKAIIEGFAEQRVDPAVDLEFRDQVRAELGLPLFPSLSSADNGSVTVDFSEPQTEARLLDVEVVAIYW